ncbi:MAG: hypothetical protein LBJ87_11800, partial [bacterium]|nr:hypothetical protein [bacterium]
MPDKEGRVLTWNTGAARMNGCTQGEIIGTRCSRLYPGPTAPAMGWGPR